MYNVHRQLKLRITNSKRLLLCGAHIVLYILLESKLSFNCMKEYMRVLYNDQKLQYTCYVMNFIYVKLPVLVT